MLKKYLLICVICAILVLVVAQTGTAGSTKSKNKCKLVGGELLKTFTGAKNLVRFGCKFHAVRRQACGKYLVNVTPQLRLMTVKGSSPPVRSYAIDYLFIGLKRLSDKKGLNIKLTTNTTRMFFSGEQDQPFEKKDGCLDVDEVYTNITTNCNKKKVVLKAGPIVIKFRLFDGKNPKTSTFSFQCKSEDFKMAPAEKQLCGGNSSSDAQITKEVFNYEGLVQKENSCESASRHMQKNCKNNKHLAARLCRRLVYKKRFYNCLESPIKSFRQCIKFVCSGFTDPNACCALRRELAVCKGQKLKGVSDMLDSKCPAS